MCIASLSKVYNKSYRMISFNWLQVDIKSLEYQSMYYKQGISTILIRFDQHCTIIS